MTCSEPEVIYLEDDADGVVELFLTDTGAPQDTSKPALLIVHGHQFPARPGGQGRVTPELVSRMSSRGGIVAALSQPGYGGSSGPPDCCGPKTQRALRLAFAYLVERGADPAQALVWGLSRGAIAASCAFVNGSPEPGILVLQAGTYDMEGWVKWVRDGAIGGQLEFANAILANQELEAGLSREALRCRSGVVHAPHGSCDVLLVHGARDPQVPTEDLERMVAALCNAGRRVETAIAQCGEHRLPPNLALDALAKHWPHLAL